MTPRIVALEDIHDISAWVKWQVGRFVSRGHATRDEFDELCDQGVVILYELHKRWRPADSPKFSAYALSLFQRRLIDWYRREIVSSGRGHIPQSKGGKRGAIQYHGMVSLNAAPSGDNVAVTFSQEPGLTHYDAVSG